MAEEKVKVIAKTRLYLMDEDIYVEPGQECLIKKSSFDILAPRGDVVAAGVSAGSAKPAVKTDKE